MPVGRLDPKQGDIARKRAGEQAHARGGRRAAKLPPLPPPTAQVCECKRPWHDGEGRCVTCGKGLGERAPL